MRQLAEEGRVAVRNVRRDVMQTSRSSDKGEVGDDEERRAEERGPEADRRARAQIDDLLKRKEAEIMEV